MKKIDLNYCNVFLDNNDINVVMKNENLITPIECLNRTENPHLRFLGLLLDPHLTFKCHITSLAQKLSKSLYILKSVKNLLPAKVLLTLYYSIFHCHILYALPAYGCADQSVLRQILILQKKAVRIISRSHYNSHTEPIFKSLGILQFFDLIEYVKIDFMHAVNKGKAPSSFSTTWGGEHDLVDQFYLDLRNYRNYRVPFARLNFSEKLPLHSFPKAWNNLDHELRDITYKKEFRNKLKDWFLSKLSTNISCNNPFCRDCFS